MADFSAISSLDYWLYEQKLFSSYLTAYHVPCTGRATYDRYQAEDSKGGFNTIIYRDMSKQC